MHETNLAGAEAALGVDYPTTLISRNCLATAYRSAGQLTKALPLLQRNLPLSVAQLREALAIQQRSEPDLWGTYRTQSLLGGALLGQQKYADAEPLLLAGYAGMKQRAAKIPASGRARVTEALRRLVQFYDTLGKPAE